MRYYAVAPRADDYESFRIPEPDEPLYWYRQSQRRDRLLPDWQAPRAVVVDGGRHRRRLPPGDYPMFKPVFPMFSARAAAVLGDLLDGGELLPVETNQGEYGLFHILRVPDVLDRERSDLVFLTSGGILTANVIHLKGDPATMRGMFRAEGMAFPIFVDQSFVDRVAAADLTGFQYQEVNTGQPYDMLWRPGAVTARSR
jgi:hypothetical protein